MTAKKQNWTTVEYREYNRERMKKRYHENPVAKQRQLEFNNRWLEKHKHECPEQGCKTLIGLRSEKCIKHYQKRRKKMIVELLKETCDNAGGSFYYDGDYCITVKKGSVEKRLPLKLTLKEYDNLDLKTRMCKWASLRNRVNYFFKVVDNV